MKKIALILFTAIILSSYTTHTSQKSTQRKWFTHYLKSKKKIAGKETQKQSWAKRLKCVQTESDQLPTPKTPQTPVDATAASAAFDDRHLPHMGPEESVTRLHRKIVRDMKKIGGATSKPQIKRDSTEFKRQFLYNSGYTLLPGSSLSSAAQELAETTPIDPTAAVLADLLAEAEELTSDDIFTCDDENHEDS